MMRGGRGMDRASHFLGFESLTLWTSGSKLLHIFLASRPQKIPPFLSAGATSMFSVTRLYIQVGGNH